MKKLISLGLMALISIIGLSAIYRVASAKEQEPSGGKMSSFQRDCIPTNAKCNRSRFSFDGLTHKFEVKLPLGSFYSKS
jgi:hypothetical protein